MTKEYGRLTEDQFKQVIRQLPELRRESEDFQATLRKATPEKFRELVGNGLQWAWLYEKPMALVIGYMVVLIGKADSLVAATAQPDPQETILREWLDSNSPEPESVPEGFSVGHLVMVAIALQRHIMSIFIHKRSMSALIEETRQGSDRALFDAIRIDRSVLSCPTVAARISKAEALGDKRFFLHLRNALKGPTGKHWRNYQDLRYSLALLRDMGCDNLSDKQLEHLLVDVLGVYPKSYSARKNLRQQYYQSKKIASM